MSDRMGLRHLSRYGVFSLFGFLVIGILLLPATVMMPTSADARVGKPASAVSVAGANRRDRRDDRRDDRNTQQTQKKKKKKSASQ
jgi:hypothetical protein